MKKVFRISILGLILLLVGDISLSAQSAADIVKKMDQVVYSPKNMKGKNKIILIDKNGKEEVREAIVNQLGNNKRLMRFTAPASQAGISVLSLPNDVMYLYLPAYGKERGKQRRKNPKIQYRYQEAGMSQRVNKFERSAI
jgi:hypothetical protein